jgi:mercuric ion transport protein
MGNRKLLTTGLVGTVVTASCCATPVLAVILGAIGLSAWPGWADYVLIPALLVFVGVTVYAVARGLPRAVVSSTMRARRGV